MNTLSWIDWTIFGGYLALVFALGLWFMRGQQTSEDYFLGGRKMSWWAVGVSLFATAFSSISFVAYPREAAYQGFHFFVAILFIPLVITPLLWWLFVPMYVRLGVTSVYEYLELRFNRPIRRLGTILFACYAIGWMGSMLYAVGLIVQTVLGLTEIQLVWTLVAVGLFAMLYTVLGGIQAVIWTDVLQTITLGGGMLVVFFLALGQVDGGWATVVRLGTEHGRFEMFNMELDLADRSTFYSACAFGLFMYLPGYTTSQVTAQRYVCMPSLAHARRALAIHAVTITLVCLLFFLVGTTLFAYYEQHGGMPDLPANKQDQILPLFVTTALGQGGLVGLLVAGLFAAAMSTVDSGINSLTAVVVYDWLSGRELRVAYSRLLCGLFGISVIGAALVVPYLASNVIGMITTIASTFLGLLLGVYLLGLLVPRANGAGALLGLLAGAGTLGAVILWTDVPHWWYGAFTCLPAFFVGWLASYAFDPPRPEQMRGVVYRSCFIDQLTASPDA
ncbi:MAG TPA: sodium/solute symporter [Thermoguttaceae bacterium]|nr:sodium/solute symporter [Thermoguttaceae bacterium]